MPNSVGGYYFNELEIGQVYDFTKIITKEDVHIFAQATGDNNPIHLDEDYAKTTIFGECIAHGILTAGVVSSVIGTKMPGPGCIYISQTMQFKRPVKIGAELNIKVEILTKDEKRNYVTIATNANVNGKSVLTGEATVMVPNA